MSDTFRGGFYLFGNYFFIQTLRLEASAKKTEGMHNDSRHRIDRRGSRRSLRNDRGDASKVAQVEPPQTLQCHRREPPERRA